MTVDAIIAVSAFVGMAGLSVAVAAGFRLAVLKAERRRVAQWSHEAYLAALEREAGRAC